jgi:hypothetical protein
MKLIYIIEEKHYDNSPKRFLHCFLASLCETTSLDSFASFHCYPFCCLHLRSYLVILIAYFVSSEWLSWLSSFL